MTDASPRDQGLAGLSLDPELLARELAAELDGDPLDAIAIDDGEEHSLDAARACDQGLILLTQGHDQRLQGLQVFCEHRDPRAVPLLLPLCNVPARLSG